MTSVAIVGSSSALGCLLLQRLDEDDTIDSVIGLDSADPPVQASKLDFRPFDLRQDGLEEIVSGVDALVHLALTPRGFQDEGFMRDVNIGGIRRVLAASGDVGRLVVVGSVTAYGARADNDYPLTEESRLRANADFSLGEHAQELERIVSSWREENDTKCAVLRMGAIVGPSVESFISPILESPVVPVVTGYSPPFQFVAEEDAAAAVHFAIGAELDGPFNVASDEMSGSELLDVLGKRRIPIPEAVLAPAAKVAWKSGIGPVPSGAINYLMHPWVMSTAKLAKAGFAPRYSSREAVAQGVGRYVTVGRKRMTRVEFEAALRRWGGGAAALLLAGWMLRRKR